jgi:hypothetical protein
MWRRNPKKTMSSLIRRLAKQTDSFALKEEFDTPLAIVATYQNRMQVHAIHLKPLHLV